MVNVAVDWCYCPYLSALKTMWLDPFCRVAAGCIFGPQDVLYGPCCKDATMLHMQVSILSSGLTN